jgi:hypothetical protein
MQWWDSIATMSRIVKMLMALLLTCGVLAVAGALWFTGMAIVAAVVGSATLASALFAAFRLNHLRELDRLGQ